MKQCPVCTLELDKMIGDESIEDELFICKNNYHESDTVFSAVYKVGTDELVFFNLMLGNYYIENCYPRNKTNILIKEKGNDNYIPFLFLPLVHFEQCNLVSIKSRLKLIVMMY